MIKSQGKDEALDSRSSRASKRPPGWLRMNELAKAVGLPRSAILHYLSQGLLPEPARTGPNMAYYDPACIERIQFIKTMQDRYAFPLSKIRLLLNERDRGTNINPLIDLNETVFGPARGKELDETSFHKATGLGAGEVKALIRHGLLIPLQEARFDSQDVEIGRIYAAGFKLGISISDIAFYAEEARRIVDREMKLRSRLTAGLQNHQDAELTRSLVRAARATRNYVIDRIFQKRIASASGLKDKKLLKN